MLNIIECVMYLLKGYILRKIKIDLFLYCLLFIVTSYGEEIPFPLNPRLSSKLDAKSYAMGETYMFSDGAASIWQNPSRIGRLNNITFGTEYEIRKDPFEIICQDVLYLPQLIGITYSFEKTTLGLLYFIPYNLETHDYTGDLQTILRNLSIGCNYKISSNVTIGGTLGLLWGYSEHKYISQYTKDVCYYKVKGFQGLIGLDWQYSPKIEIGLVLKSPAYLTGDCEWNYSGTNWWNNHGDTTFTKIYSINERYFYPINISTGISIKLNESFTLNTQLSYIGWHVEEGEWYYSFRENELEMNVGLDWQINRYLSFRAGSYIFYFPSPKDYDISKFVPSYTGGLGIKIPFGTIGIAIGGGENIEFTIPQERYFILVDLNINFRSF